ncbi:MAG: DegQ family serine endoprotease [Sedimentisphaerales bacterium]|nr:DegQ family serine endoprotease [Sedimentisphaerales bacterium]
MLRKPTMNKISHITIIAVLFSFLVFPLFAQDEQSVDALRQIGKAFTTIAEKASPAVVGIEADKIYVQQYQDFPYWFFEDPFFDNDDMLKKFFGTPRDRQKQQPKERKFKQTVQGSGFIVSQDGYILTNNHLVGEADKVRVQLDDKTDPLEAKVIGADPESDVALIKIENGDKLLSFLELADSENLQVGEWVIAIGNPFGLSHTVTAGIVSAKGRTNVGITTYENFIQTDAAINPGNSGGPLLNLDGKVVGINTAIISRSGGNMGIGLAIPVNMAKSIYQQLIDTGKVVRGYLGVTLQQLTPDLAESFDLKDTKGVILTEVLEDSAAAKAGLKYKDVIIEFNGKPVEEVRELQKQVALLSPGTEVKVVALRDGKRKEFTVTLDERPKPEKLAAKDQKIEATEALGLTVQDLNEDLAKRYGYEKLSGVIVTNVEMGSPAQQKGIEPGLLITEVNNKKIDNVKDFNEQMKDVKAGDKILLTVTDGRYRRFIPLQVPENEEEK